MLFYPNKTGVLSLKYGFCINLDELSTGKKGVRNDCRGNVGAIEN